jgi:ASC-1-like (ASCH) protein
MAMLGKVQAPLRFSYLKDESKFFGHLKNNLPGEVFHQCLKGDLTCEVLLENEIPQGWIVYKEASINSAQNTVHKIFEVNTCRLEPTSPEKLEEFTRFFKDRIIKQADRRQSNQIRLAFVSEQLLRSSTSKDWFLERMVQSEATKSLLNEDTNRKRKREGMDESKEVDASLPIQEPKPKQVKMPTTHFLPMSGTIYFEYIMSGKKKYEGRVNRGTCAKMQVGDILKMLDNRAGWGIECEVVSKDKFTSFRDMLVAKGVINMLPQLEPKASQLSNEALILEGIKIYNSFPGSQSVQSLGAVAIGVKFLKKITR